MVENICNYMLDDVMTPKIYKELMAECSVAKLSLMLQCYGL